MRKSDIEKMTDEELLQLSMQKGKKGCYTRDANYAMVVRRERSGHWFGVSRVAPTFLEQEYLYQGAFLD